MNDDVKMREQLSALADGQLHGEYFVQAMAYAETPDGRADWQMYHLVGDVLRSSELAQPADSRLLDRLRVQLANESQPAALEVGGTTLVAPADLAGSDALVANASVFQWKLAAGFASLAAVAAIGWNAYVGLQGPATTGAQLAAAPATGQTIVTVADGSNGQQMMIRDPRLDELLAAHKQFGSTSALQMPAGFLRNATFESPAR